MTNSEVVDERIENEYIDSMSMDSPMHIQQRKEGNVLFNDTFNTFYLRLYGVSSNKGANSAVVRR